MTIREATPGDLDMMVRMGQHFLALVYPGQLRDNPSQLAALGQQLIAGSDTLLLVAERGGGIVGMLGMIVFVHPMSGERTASELFWWIEPEHRGSGMRLLRRGEQWARARGAELLLLIAPTDKVARFYERIGLVRMETSYQRRLV